MHRNLYKGMATLLILVIAAGIWVPDNDGPEWSGYPDGACRWWRTAGDDSTKWISSGTSQPENGHMPGGSPAAGSRLCLPDADMDDTGIPSGGTVCPVFSSVRFFHLNKSAFPPSAPANSIYKPPKNA